MINLSIIILSWNTKLLLMQCLESLVKNLEGRSEIELIVVDNASVDGSQEMVEENFPKVKLIKNKINFGFALGNNMGIGAALGKYIMLLNSDTVVKKGAIKKLLAYLGNNDNCAVSPLLVLPDGCPQFDYYMHFPNLWQVFFYHNPLLRPAMMRTSIKKLVYQEAKEIPFKVDQLPGAALMTSKEVWQKVGDLDSDFQFLWEDVDWSWRARKNGVKLMVVPEAEIVHLGGGSWKKKLKNNKKDFYRQFFASMLLFVKKNYPSSRHQLFKLAIAINFLLTLKLSLFFELITGNFNQKNLWK